MSDPQQATEFDGEDAPGLVEMLRARPYQSAKLCEEAATEIERLRSGIRKIAEYAEGGPSQPVLMARTLLDSTDNW